MAKFCTSCGSPAGDGQKFCNKCGSPVDALTSSPAPASAAPTSAPSASPPPNAITAAAPAAAAPVAAAPPAASSKSGSSAVKIIVAIVGFLALISVLAIGSCFYIGYKVRQKARSLMTEARSAGTTTSSTPEMQLSGGGAGSSAAAAATIDVPPYPGSTPTASGGQLSAGLSGSASAQEYETDDSVDKVASYYKDKLGSKITLMESGGNSVFNYLTSRGMTTVTLSRDEGTGKTKINIARIGK